jgi:hypothetical protein
LHANFPSLFRLNGPSKSLFNTPFQKKKNGAQLNLAERKELLEAIDTTQFFFFLSFFSGSLFADINWPDKQGGFRYHCHK